MGGRNAGMYALLVCLTLLFSGCLYPDLQEWGEEGIEVSYDRVGGSAILSQHSGDYRIDEETVNLIGCDSNGSLSVDAPSTAKKVKIEGWLHLSKHFPDGSESSFSGEALSASAVIIQLGKYENAHRPIEGKVEGVKWVTPVASVQARPPGFNTFSDFPQMGWAVVGLIPANENILEGFAGLDWHQPIALEGWLLDGQYMGYREIHVTDDGDCRIYAGMNNAGFGGYMLVTSMTLGNHGEINAANSYEPYSVPLLGTWLYTLLILASLGGATFLFFATNGLIRRGAKISARELMTEAQMLAAKMVKKEIAQDIKRVQRETGEKVKVKTEKAKVIKAETISERPTVKLDDFDVDAVLYSEHRPSTHSIKSASSSGVVQTAEAIDLVEKMDEMDAARELEEAMREAGGVMMPAHLSGPQPRESVAPSGAMKITQDSQVGMSGPPREGDNAAPPGVRTRKAKKKVEAVEPPPVHKPTRADPDITDDEDFSDFSL